MKGDENKIVVDCEFHFQCPQVWNALAPTSDDRIRYCDACHRDVHFCENDEEIQRHANAGQCVAALAYSDTEEGVIMIGEPDATALSKRGRVEIGTHGRDPRRKDEKE